MGRKFEEIKEPLRKALEAVIKNPDIAKGYIWGIQYKEELTIEDIDNAAGNHLFDDEFELLGIEKIQGHMIREYIQGGATGYNPYNYINEIHSEFKDILGKDSESYIARANKHRIEVDVDPIILD